MPSRLAGAHGRSPSPGRKSKRQRTDMAIDETEPVTAAPADMSAEEFRRYGYQAIDWIADYLAHGERYAVLSRVTPGEIRAQLPPAPPQEPEAMAAILEDFDRVIMP